MELISLCGLHKDTWWCFWLTEQTKDCISGKLCQITFRAFSQRLCPLEGAGLELRLTWWLFSVSILPDLFGEHNLLVLSGLTDLGRTLSKHHHRRTLILSLSLTRLHTLVYQCGPFIFTPYTLSSTWTSAETWPKPSCSYLFANSKHCLEVRDDFTLKSTHKENTRIVYAHMAHGSSGHRHYQLIINFVSL